MLGLSGCRLAGEPWWGGRQAEVAETAAEKVAQDAPDPAQPEEAAPETAPGAAQAPDPIVTALGSDAWYEAVAPREPLTEPPTEALLGAPPKGPFTWRHTGVEALVADPQLTPAALSPALASPQPVVAANGAMVAVRRGWPVDPALLAAAVRLESARPSLRAAAAEALGAAGTASAQAALRDELDREPAPNRPPRVERSLVEALARQADPADAPRLVARLSHAESKVRLAALAGLLALPAPLPGEALELRSDPDPRVRAQVCQALAMHGSTQASDWLAGLLADEQIPVRVAALTALGSLPGPANVETLRTATRDTREVIRAAAVAALATQGDWDSVLAAAGDESWRVRLAVAAALAAHPTPASAQVARELVADPSGECATATIEAARSWPLPLAGPVWLEALSRSGYRSRQRAGELLASAWPPARDFPCDAPAAERANRWTALQAAWSREFGRIELAAFASRAAGAARDVGAAVAPETWNAVQRLVGVLSQQAHPEALDAACRELIALGPPVAVALGVMALEQQIPLPPAVYERVLPAVSPQFAILAQLADQDNALRRAAAAELVEWIRREPLTALALARLAELTQLETDPEVWRDVLIAVADDPREAAAQIALAALQHSLAEIRRRGCEHLAEHPDRRHAPALLAAVGDAHVGVSRAAVRALGEPGVLADPAPLEALLNSPDKWLQLEAARSLARLGAPRGVAAVERLAYDSDPEICRRAMDTMGEVADPEFLPALVDRVGESREGIGPAAARALERIVGQPPPATDPDGRPLPNSLAARWRAWWETARGGQVPGVVSQAVTGPTTVSPSVAVPPPSAIAPLPAAPAVPIPR